MNKEKFTRAGFEPATELTRPILAVTDFHHVAAILCFSLTQIHVTGRLKGKKVWSPFLLYESAMIIIIAYRESDKNGPSMMKVYCKRRNKPRATHGCSEPCTSTDGPPRADVGTYKIPDCNFHHVHTTWGEPQAEG